MDAKVTSPFVDKHTGRVYQKDDLFQGDAERVSELIKWGYVEVIAKKKEEPHETEEIHAETGPKKGSRRKK